MEQHRANDPRIDYYVCGSDQIWNPDLGGDGFYFANFAEKNKRVAYAASFGVETLPEKMAVDYTEYLKGMSHISVREHAGAALIKELVQKDVPVVVDPTMLLSREEWLPMMKKPTYPLKERFMLTYFLGGYSDDAQNYIKKVAQEHDLQIVSLNSMCKDCYWFGTGPSEFLWLIENAAVVCTNSFHGTVFSIIMNTPFINFRRGSKTNSMHSRIETLLRTMQLTGRVYGEVKEECLFDMDYQHVTGILESEKKRSIEYLRNALNLSDEANCLQ